MFKKPFQILESIFIHYQYSTKKKKHSTSMSALFLNGRKDGIRTHDLLVPNQAHYQAVLLPGLEVKE